MPSTKELLAIANQESYTVAPKTMEVRIAGSPEVANAKVLPSVGAVAVRNAGLELTNVHEQEVQAFAESLDHAIILDTETGYDNRFMYEQQDRFLAQRAEGDDCGWE